MLYNSEGSVKENTICENQRSGILCGGQTTAEFTNNEVTANISIGILIKDPSAPILRENKINGNYYQLSLEKTQKRLDVYLTQNQIEGKNELPKSACCIF